MSTPPTPTADDLISIANDAYGDGIISDYARGEDRYDTLGLFIVRELRDTYDPEHPHQSAIDALDTARNELDTVIAALERARDTTERPPTT